MEKIIRNYIPIKKFSLRYQYYAYVDTIHYYADRIFIQNKIPVQYGPEYQKSDKDYVIIFCKVRKSDTERFKKALQQLNKNIMICGYPDYPDFCKTLFETMEKERKNLKTKVCNTDREKRSKTVSNNA